MERTGKRTRSICVTELRLILLESCTSRRYSIYQEMYSGAGSSTNFGGAHSRKVFQLIKLEQGHDLSTGE